MVCVQCGQKTEVINSRPQKRNNHVWRRRQCVGCGTVFTTEETIDYGAAWTVRSQKGRLSPFSRDKLLLSVHRSCQHRPKALQEASELADTIIRKLIGEAHNGLLQSGTITHTVQVALNRFDKAASVHYAAFHKS